MNNHLIVGYTLIGFIIFGVMAIFFQSMLFLTLSALSLVIMLYYGIKENLPPPPYKQIKKPE